MMTDLIKRLRKDADLLENGPYIGIKSCRENFREAADEIERMRKDREGKPVPPKDMPGTGPYRLQNVPWKRVADGECL